MRVRDMEEGKERRQFYAPSTEWHLREGEDAESRSNGASRPSRVRPKENLLFRQKLKFGKMAFLAEEFDRNRTFGQIIGKINCSVSALLFLPLPLSYVCNSNAICAARDCWRKNLTETEHSAKLLGKLSVPLVHYFLLSAPLALLCLQFKKPFAPRRSVGVRKGKERKEEKVRGKCTPN